MKQVLGIWGIGPVFLAVLAVDCLAVDPYQGEQADRGAYMVYWGTTTDPSDTFGTRVMRFRM